MDCGAEKQWVLGWWVQVFRSSGSRTPKVEPGIPQSSAKNRAFPPYIRVYPYVRSALRHAQNCLTYVGSNGHHHNHRHQASRLLIVPPVFDRSPAAISPSHIHYQQRTLETRHSLARTQQTPSASDYAPKFRRRVPGYPALRFVGFFPSLRLRLRFSSCCSSCSLPPSSA